MRAAKASECTRLEFSKHFEHNSMILCLFEFQNVHLNVVFLSVIIPATRNCVRRPTEAGPIEHEIRG